MSKHRLPHLSASIGAIRARKHKHWSLGLSAKTLLSTNQKLQIRTIWPCRQLTQTPAIKAFNGHFLIASNPASHNFQTISRVESAPGICHDIDSAASHHLTKPLKDSRLHSQKQSIIHSGSPLALPGGGGPPGLVPGGGGPCPPGGPLKPVWPGGPLNPETLGGPENPVGGPLKPEGLPGGALSAPPPPVAPAMRTARVLPSMREPFIALMACPGNKNTSLHNILQSST